MEQLRATRRAGRELEVRPDTRTAILDATERLLAATPLHELTVAQIMEAAEVSRGLLLILQLQVRDGRRAARAHDVRGVRLMRAAIDAVDRPPTQRSCGLPGRLHPSLAEHRAVLRASHENWHAVPELREQWLARGAIHRRSRASPQPKRWRPTSALRRRVASALWATERLEYIADAEVDADVQGGDELIDTLMEYWAPLLRA